jgi:hypothetical protein
MECKYDTVKTGTFMRSCISEDWNICEVIIFVVVPFVNYNLHQSIYTHTHTHTRVLCLRMECCTRRISFFDGEKALKNMLKGLAVRMATV